LLILILRGVIILDIKEMPIDERYDRLLDDYLLDAVTDYAVLKELGGVDKQLDLSVKMTKKTLPKILGSPVFKLLKVLAPGRTFKQLSSTWLYNAQTWHPLSTIEVTNVSDREVAGGVKNCVLLKRMRDIVKKTDLEIDPKFLCEKDAKYFPKLFKEFGIDMTWKLEENGCRFTAKLK
jgi:hypothetical protein